MTPCGFSQGIPELPELKLRYYELMIQYHLHNNNYIEVTRSYKAMYDTDDIQADAAKWQQVGHSEGASASHVVVVSVVWEECDAHVKTVKH